MDPDAARTGGREGEDAEVGTAVCSGGHHCHPSLVPPRRALNSFQNNKVN
jgi:hypothetical protein